MSEENNDKSAEAAKIVRNHAVSTMVIGILPLPLIDIAILGGVQLRMLSKLAELYEVEFSEQRANAIIGALCGISAVGSAGSVLRMIPGIGQMLAPIGALTLPPASTYALGQVFIKHFSTGGTFLNFNADEAKEEYEEKVTEGKKVVEQNFAGIKP